MIKEQLEYLQNELAQTRQALELYQTRFKNIVTHNAYAIVVMNGHGLIEYINRAAEEILARPASELLGTYFDIVPISGDTGEAMITRPDGSEIPVALQISDTEWNGQAASMITIRDISGRKEIEKALSEERALLSQRVEERTQALSQANEQLERAAQLKDQFLANMSHELRTPLHAILGLSEGLQEEVYGPLNNKQKQYLSTIEESGRLLLALINDILDLSKIEADKLSLDIRPTSIKTLCEASLRLVKQNAQQKRLKVHFENDIDDDQAIINIDLRRMKQILVNLLSNAIKFTPNDGDIGLKISADYEHECVDFTVWDTGIGIGPEDIPKLTEPFIQIDSSLSRQYSGTGLGLSLVAKLAEMHDGRLNRESKGIPGQGSRFTVVIPWSSTSSDDKKLASLSSDGAEHALTVASEQSVSFKILLVEDNEAHRNMLASYLLIKGYQVILAQNGVQALKQVRAERPDLVLMDIEMPDIDGLETIRRLRQLKDYGQLPIVALTALTMPGDRERCLEVGANYYLSKPCQVRDLMAIINEHISRPLLGDQR